MTLTLICIRLVLPALGPGLGLHRLTPDPLTIVAKSSFDVLSLVLLSGITSECVASR